MASWREVKNNPVHQDLRPMGARDNQGVPGRGPGDQEMRNWSSCPENCLLQVVVSTGTGRPCGHSRSCCSRRGLRSTTSLEWMPTQWRGARTGAWACRRSPSSCGVGQQNVMGASGQPTYGRRASRPRRHRPRRPRPQTSQGQWQQPLPRSGTFLHLTGHRGRGRKAEAAAEGATAARQRLHYYLCSGPPDGGGQHPARGDGRRDRCRGDSGGS